MWVWRPRQRRPRYLCRPAGSDRQETRLRALIDAKLKGEGIDAGEEPEIVTSNVVDLMETLRKSLGQVNEEKPAAREKAAPKRSAAQAATKPSRKRA